MRFSLLLILIFAFNFGWSQTKKYTEAKILRGKLRPERTCFDVNFYNLNIDIDIKNKFIFGFNEIQYTVIEDFTKMQIDLFENMKISKITYKNQILRFDRIENAVFITIPFQKKGNHGSIKVYYEGNPIVARRAPWDGGFVWTSSKSNQPWVGVACEGTGASLWWPNKDHLSDEPDSMAINITVPQGLTCVSNGVLRSTKKENDDKTSFHWFVSYPINNYNVTLNIADYVHFTDIYIAEDGDSLDLDYYVLPENLKKAKKQFLQSKDVLACYEKYFGKYPFWNDGYALVETPYLGMEHQGAIAYGNKYRQGYLGNSPLNMHWDYIIVHESGHEYWGNSISCNDHAEMWIHESFTTYMESLFVEYMYDYPKAVDYLLSQKRNIYNDSPLVGPMDVNYDGWVGSDIYYKGAWVLHTLRNVFNDDKKWFDFLKAFYLEHRISNITTADFTKAASKALGKNLDAFFNQYLYETNIPTLVYSIEKKRKKLILKYHWKNVVDDFDMPIKVGNPGHYVMINPSSSVQKIVLKDVKMKDFRIADELFYVEKEQGKK